MALPSNEPLSKTGDLALDSADPAISAGETVSADPITGEPGAHPAAVGVGALSAGAAGAAIGAFAGPVGIVIGAAIGAIAGGLAGHEAGVANETPATTDELAPDESASAGDFVEPSGATTSATGQPSSVAATPEEDTLTVFPGSDLGAPAVLAVPAGKTGDGTQSDPVPTAGTNTAETVRTGAFYRFLDRQVTGRAGDELSDWLEAEREVSRF